LSRFNRARHQSPVFFGHVNFSALDDGKSDASATPKAGQKPRISHGSKAESTFGHPVTPSEGVYGF